MFIGQTHLLQFGFLRALVFSGFLCLTIQGLGRELRKVTLVLVS